ALNHPNEGSRALGFRKVRTTAVQPPSVTDSDGVLPSSSERFSPSLSLHLAPILPPPPPPRRRKTPLRIPPAFIPFPAISVCVPSDSD
ncbi:hypothetical protein M569_14467, partial [Genlisea aurea]